jgi:hypothetical protein
MTGKKFLGGVTEYRGPSLHRVQRGGATAALPAPTTSEGVR